MQTQADVFIVGAGPTGLTLAWLWSLAGFTCLVADAASAPGGCHRVDRSQNGHFSEHGPRIYSTAYTTTRAVFETMGLNFDDFFVPYSFSSVGIGREIVKQLNAREWLAFASAFARFVGRQDFGLEVSMRQFMEERRFRPKTRELIDALCRLTDGARADRYSLNQFLQLLNQSIPTRLLQPRAPNDRGWVAAWTGKILASGRVRLWLNAPVERLIADPQNSRIVSAHVGGPKPALVFAKQFVLAVPPAAALPLLETSGLARTAFGLRFPEWAAATRYIDYVSVAYSWRQRIAGAKAYHPSVGDWGVVFVFLSDYFEDEPGTLLSAAVTTPTSPSKSTGLNAFETLAESPERFMREVLRQIRAALEGAVQLPPPDTSVLAPMRDTAFVHAAGTDFLLPDSPAYKNLATVGSHNGATTYAFTSLEAAVCAAVAYTKTPAVQVSSGATLLRWSRRGQTS